jgi:hypothetical protein
VKHRQEPPRRVVLKRAARNLFGRRKAKGLRVERNLRLHRAVMAKRRAQQAEAAPIDAPLVPPEHAVTVDRAGPPTTWRAA